MRRLFPQRFSLRRLFLLTTALCIALGYWMWSSVNQRETVARLRQLKYNVEYNKSASGDVIRNSIAKLLGDDFIFSVNGLYSNDTSGAFDGDLENVASLRSLRKLTLDFTAVDDDDLAAVAGHPKLDFLMLNFSNVTDRGISHLVDLPLVSLHMDGLGITDNCVSHLEQIKTLRHVSFSAGCLSPAGLARLKSALPECQFVIQ